MRPGMQPLLDLVRGRLQPQPFDDAEWAALLDLAEEENILPWAVDRLRALETSCTEKQKTQLDEIRRQSQLEAFVWAETLKSLLAAFDRAALPVISLKGPWLAERLYGDAALRTCCDLDLLVRRSDLAAAEQLLADLGFVPNFANDYHREWSRHPIKVELHHNVENPLAFNFDLDTVWARARLSCFDGVPAWLFDPTDEFVYLCLHAVRHCFERLCHILDLTLAIRVLTGSVAGTREWDNPELQNTVTLGWMMARRLEPQIPEAMFVYPGDRIRLEKLADKLWQKRMLEPAETLNWVVQHRFYLELETPGWQRLLRRGRHLVILLLLVPRLCDEDFAFAELFKLHRRWQVRMVKPIRLFMKYFKASSRTI